ncbi:MAG: toll/interleukin-1 receptor domain-containing protein, partial [Anaerolineaceae bacterium]|nr:toll/interleukin-1 receptor domain-containing protein [Anaerolineaceae bacterium]
MAHDVFVSYSSKDKTVADSIVAAMENNGIRCWYAPRDIQPGDDWAEAITNAIDACQVFLMVFSENANQSQRVLDELNYAVSQEVVILPFRIENLIPRRAMMLHLSSRHWLDAYDPTWESHIKKLVQTVSVNLDKTLSDEEIEVPAQVEQRKARQKKISAWMIVIWAIVGVAAVVGAWSGLSKLLPGGQNPETTEEIQTSQPTENIAAQEVTATEEVALTE